MKAIKSYIADIYVRLSKEDGYIDTGSKYEGNSISNQKELIQQFLDIIPGDISACNS